MSEQALPRGKAQPAGGALLAAEAAVRGPPVIAQAVRLSVALPTRLTLQGKGPVHSQVMLAKGHQICFAIDPTSNFRDRDPLNPETDPKADPQQSKIS
jgi:hypothetical protein